MADIYPAQGKNKFQNTNAQGISIVGSGIITTGPEDDIVITGAD